VGGRSWGVAPNPEGRRSRGVAPNPTQEPFLKERFLRISKELYEKELYEKEGKSFFIKFFEGSARETF
jgi:hypothetical protein